jgi:hypothetical protein
MPKNPTSAIFLRSSSGICPSTGSSSFATGNTSRIAKSRAISRIASWSFVSSTGST